MCQLYVLTSKNQSSDSSEPRTQYSKWITSSWPNCLDIIWYRVCTVQHWINDRHAYSMQTRRIRRLHFHCTRGNATGICALYRNVLRFQRLKQPSTLWTARALKHLVFLPPRKHNDTTIGQSWQSLPHSLRLSAEKCKPNARSSWSSSPGQNGRSHQNNALASAN